MESSLRFGLIGVGRHGSRYAKHIHEDLPEIDLVGLWRRDPVEWKRQARQYGCRYFPTYSELLADKSIDAVVVALPPVLNASVCEEAAFQRKHILLEKPMAINLREAVRINQAVSLHGVRLMVSQTLRFSGVVAALKARIPSLGSLHSIHLSQRFEPSPLAWLDQRDLSGGGIVLHTGVHSFDLLRFLTGEQVDKVSCRVNRVVTRETEDNFSAIMTFANSNVIASVMGSRGTKGRSGLIEVAGENGQLIADHVHNYLHEVRGMEQKPVELGNPVLTVYEVLKAFHHSLCQELPFPVTIEDGIIAVAIAEGCYRSAETGRWENVRYPCPLSFLNGKGGMNMGTSDLVEKTEALRQSYKAKAERDPAGMIGQEAADAFNKLLDESKKRCPKNRFIEKMHPVTPGRTQLAGFLATVSVLEDSLKAEKAP